MEYRIDGPLEGHADIARVAVEPVGCSCWNPWCDPGESSEMGEGVNSTISKSEGQHEAEVTAPEMGFDCDTDGTQYILLRGCSFKTHFM